MGPGDMQNNPNCVFSSKSSLEDTDNQTNGLQCCVAGSVRGVYLRWVWGNLGELPQVSNPF